MRIASSAVTFFAGLTLAACVTSSNDEPDLSITLVGEEWVVEDIGARGVMDYARATMRFGQDGRLTGNTSCNHYFADYQTDGMMLQIGNAGATKRACTPAVMDQESRFLNVLSRVHSYQVDGTGALVLSTPDNTTITARRLGELTSKVTYRCPDNSLVEAWYPTRDTATIIYRGQSIAMTLVVSASGARYVGGGWQWWTKGMTEGSLAPLAGGEDIASVKGMTCTVP